MTPWEKAGCATAWWHQLRPDEHNPGNRAALVRLRRAATLLDAAEEEATIRLAQQIGGRPALEDAALCAAVLAGVRDNEQQRTARRLGAQNGEAPLMSPLRFRRLIQADTHEDRLIQFRRLIALAGHKVNVTDLATALLDWSDRRRRDWIFQYYNAEPPKSDNTAHQPVSEGTAS